MRTTPLIPENAAPERSWIILRNVDSTGRKLLFSREKSKGQNGIEKNREGTN
ncbi:hypothetical protein SAMN05720354_10635 [Nitrosospira sp. Nsp1]|nr:hypothetical protein SAMN05720354_10635 [Nitrosospira sp. Nsp1]